jgi:hypothetical protein
MGWIYITDKYENMPAKLKVLSLKNRRNISAVICGYRFTV